MRVSRITAVLAAFLAVVALVTGADAQQCPKGKLRLYTSWPMQGAMLPEGTGMKNGIDLAVSEVGGVVAVYCLEIVNLDDASPQTGKWDGAVPLASLGRGVVQVDDLEAVAGDDAADLGHREVDAVLHAGAFREHRPLHR